MKPANIIHLLSGMLIIIFLVSFNALSMQQAMAQESDIQEISDIYSQEELAQMLAPIALYPDALLAQVLMASTYPIEVVEADRWVKRNPELKNEILDEALIDQEWDPSIKALCHFPSILALMSEKITETVNIGNAFLAQEDEVMEMIQELRERAYASGNLTSTAEQKIIREKEIIIIEPAAPDVVYVPYYDPLTIYGPWWYPDYPPYYWGPSRVSIGLGLFYWPGFYFGFSFGNWSYVDWHQHYVYIDVRHRPRYVRHDRWPAKAGRWKHHPRHRRGVAYRDKPTARKFGQQPRRTRRYEPDARGFPDRRDRDRDYGRRRPEERAGSRRDTIREDRRTGDRDYDRRRPEEQAGSRRDTIREDRRTGDRDYDRRRPEEQAGSRRDTIREDRRTGDREYDRRRPEEQAGSRRDTIREDRRTDDREQRQRTGSFPRERVRIQPDRVKRENVQRDRQIQQQTERKRQTPQRPERSLRQRSRENVFNRVEEGGRERRSSQRGWFSRQGSRNDAGGTRRDSRDWRNSNEARGGRDRHRNNEAGDGYEGGRDRGGRRR